MKRAFNKPLYDKLVDNSFYYAPPYMPLYGFMQQTKRWPMLILSVMEWERPETKAAFREYAVSYYPKMNVDELIGQVNKWPDYLEMIADYLESKLQAIKPFVIISRNHIYCIYPPTASPFAEAIVHF